MKNEYVVFLGDKPVGHIVLQKKGLYYVYWCDCNFTDDVIYKVWLKAEGTEISLGVCVPYGGSYETHGKIPVKQIHGNDWKFVAFPNKLSRTSVILNQEIPFLGLEHLEDSRFVIENEQAKILICS